MISSNNNLGSTVYFITGVCGFVGRSILSRLLKSGNFVVGIDSAPISVVELKEYCKSGQLIFIEQDFFSAIDKIKKVLSTVKNSRKIFIHLAGLADANLCADNPAQAYSINVHLTWGVARFCAESGFDRCIFASTGYVYGTSVGMKLFRETDRIKADSVYTSTKIAAESLFSLSAINNDFNLVIMRFANIYGVDCSIKTVLGTLMNQVKQRQPIVVKDPSPIRDFIHIEDVTDALIQLTDAKLPEQVTIVNIGTGVGTRIGSLASQLAALTGGIYEGDTGENGNRLVLDIEKLYQITGWKPKIPLNMGLQQLVLSKEK